MTNQKHKTILMYNVSSIYNLKRFLEGLNDYKTFKNYFHSNRILQKWLSHIYIYYLFHPKIDNVTLCASVYIKVWSPILQSKVGHFLVYKEQDDIMILRFGLTGE